VLVLGLSTRAAAASAARAGYAVTSVDAFADRDQHADVDAIAVPRFTARAAERLARSIESDAVAYLSPFENHPAVVQALMRGRVLWGNPPDVLRRVRDPQQLADALRRRGLAVPVSEGGEYLLKPLRSGGGQGVRPWPAGARIPRGAYLQPRVAGQPGSIVVAASAAGTVQLGVSTQIAGDPAFGAAGFRYCGSILDGRAGRLADRASALATAVTEEFGLVGVNGIDFIAQGDEPVAIEVNPRWSASMELVERESGVSVFGIHAAACAAGHLPPSPVAAGSVHGKAIVFARRTVTLGDTSQWLDDRALADVPHPGQRIVAGRPVCTVFATGGDVAACYDGLVGQAEAIYAQLTEWRRSVA
jgi:predicted ATP-grasp superfamily ATP-dependent carboligase